MVSSDLQFKMHLLEMQIFPIWLNAGPKEREEITQKLARYEADEIIKEINIEANNRYEKK